MLSGSDVEIFKQDFRRRGINKWRIKSASKRAAPAKNTKLEDEDVDENVVYLSRIRSTMRSLAMIIILFSRRARNSKFEGFFQLTDGYELEG